MILAIQTEENDGMASCQALVNLYIFSIKASPLKNHKNNNKKKFFFYFLFYIFFF